MSECKHVDFKAKVSCGRMVEEHERVNMPNEVKPQTVQVDLRVECVACGAPLRFLGLRPGLNLHGAACSPDGLEARLATIVEETKP